VPVGELPLSEPAFRLLIFGLVFATMATAEFVMPRRERRFTRWTRWPSNIGIAALDAVLVRLLFPLSAVAFAQWIEGSGWGLFNVLAVPHGISVLAAFVLLDGAIYAQHVAFHAIPVLWRLHRMHHADLDFDVTTGSRFHPIEIGLSMFIKMAVIAAIGAPAAAVFAFEVVLNAGAMFNHSNARLPDRLDRVLRLFVVTPDMHRVHHSIVTTETNSNFGFNLPWWDRLFATYRDQPAAGHEGMTIGIPEFRDPSELRLDRLLAQPFRSPESERRADRIADGV
jgi:sterol desaturase/sphingolipid hydroxylase (fatty acid hydroxylase superfamily)